MRLSDLGGVLCPRYAVWISDVWGTLAEECSAVTVSRLILVSTAFHAFMLESEATHPRAAQHATGINDSVCAATEQRGKAHLSVERTAVLGLISLEPFEQAVHVEDVRAGAEHCVVTISGTPGLIYICQ